MQRLFRFFNVLCSILTISSLSAQTSVPKDFSDRILRFHSDIVIKKNGNITVRENIRVFNGDGENTPGFDPRNSIYSNNDIQRGIVRDFPTRYEDSTGFWVETGFDVVRVLRNGKEENYITNNLTNGERLMIGNEDVILPTGVIDYVIEYRTRNQLIYHNDKDEFYWNVNGNGWVFTADTISCSIQFPDGAEIIEYACYTGEQGSTASHCEAIKKSAAQISFETTRRALSYEGLTVAVSVRKGILAYPGRTQKALTFLRANYIIPLLVFLLLFQLGYYFYVWNKRGRDPRKGIIYPQFSPPEGINAADAGYILDQKFNSKLFAAALIDCAVKKKLKIEVSREGLIFKSNVYQFSQPDTPVNGYNSGDEYGFSLSSIYGLKAEKGKYNSALRASFTSLQTALKNRHLVRAGKKSSRSGLFVLNKGYVVLGFIVVIAAAFLSFQFFVTHPSLRIAVLSAGFVIAILAVHLIFRSIMSAYTPEGRKVVDHLLGFKMYLAQAEGHIYDRLAPPEKTLDLFEKYLPFAIALGVENEWSQKFDDIIEKALAAGYNPGYYSVRNGQMHRFSAAEMSRSISSGLTSTVSSASTPPSSSRGGSSGGGSSGGGGGGGGGGGW